MKTILVKSAECKVDYQHKMLIKRPPERSLLLTEVIHLLRGLLAADPNHRLSARAALCLPAFEGVRSCQGQLARLPDLHLEDMAEEADVVASDLLLPALSIKSLEKRSIAKKKSGFAGSDSDYNSYKGSLQYDSDEVSSIKKSQLGDQYKQSGFKKADSLMFSQSPVLSSSSKSGLKPIGLRQLEKQESFDSNMSDALRSPSKLSVVKADNSSPKAKQISLFSSKMASRSGEGKDLFK